MDPNCIFIGFAGTDKHDIILYLARILYHLGNKVMVVDESETGALSSCIPCPMGMENSINEYRGIYHVKSRFYEDIWNVSLHAMRVNYVLIDYGYNISEKEAAGLHQIVYVTDQQKHNIDRLIPITTYKNDNKRIVFRDVVGYAFNPKSILYELGLSETLTDELFVIYLDEVDTKCKLKSQYEIAFSFRKLSVPAKNTVKGLLIKILPSVSKKALATAYRKAEKGD